VVTAALKELTGKGASEVTGTIDLHVKADAIVKTVAAMVSKVKELTLEKIPGFNTGIFDTFISNIEGVSVINCYDAGNMPMTISNFRKAAEEKILNYEKNQEETNRELLYLREKMKESPLYKSLIEELEEFSKKNK
jgi:hypothetical protein